MEIATEFRFERLNSKYNRCIELLVNSLIFFAATFLAWSGIWISSKMDALDKSIAFIITQAYYFHKLTVIYALVLFVVVIYATYLVSEIYYSRSELRSIFDEQKIKF